MRASPDANRWNRKFTRDLGRYSGRDHLKHDGECSRLFNGAGVGEQLFSCRSSALNQVAAKAMFALRREPNVTHHRDTRSHDAPNLLSTTHPTLELDGVGRRFLHEPNGRAQRLIRTVLVAAKGKVSHDQRPLGRACDGPRQRNQFVDCDRQRCVIAKDGVARRVAHQQEIDTSTIENRCGEKVVAGQASDANSLLFCSGEVANPHALHAFGCVASPVGLAPIISSVVDHDATLSEWLDAITLALDLRRDKDPGMELLPDQLPWWIAGPLLGLLVVGLFVVANQPLGASGAYVQTIKTVRHDSDRVTWRVWYFGGIFVGGLIATIVGPGVEIRQGYDAMTAAGWSAPAIGIVVLLGAIVMGYGARVAGGCTSGHGICGTAQRSPASWATTATFMGTAVVVTFILTSLTGLGDVVMGGGQ